jgi:hypothetical protein
MRQPTIPAMNQQDGGPLVTLKARTAQVCTELLRLCAYKLTNSKMGVQFTNVNITTKDSDATTNHKNVRKQKYTTLDLLYPSGGKNSDNWKLLNAMVISWAGAQEDPFSMNSTLDMEIDMLWGSVFQDSTLDAKGRKCVLIVVRILFCDSMVYVMVNTFQVWKHPQ